MGLFVSMMYILIGVPLLLLRLVSEKTAQNQARIEMNTQYWRMDAFSKFKNYELQQSVWYMLFQRDKYGEICRRLKDCFDGCPQLKGLESNYPHNYELAQAIILAQEGCAFPGFSLSVATWGVDNPDDPYIERRIRLTQNTIDYLGRYITRKLREHGADIICGDKNHKGELRFY